MAETQRIRIENHLVAVTCHGDGRHTVTLRWWLFAVPFLAGMVVGVLLGV